MNLPVKVPEDYPKILDIFHIIGVVSPQRQRDCTKCDAKDTGSEIEFAINRALHLNEPDQAMDFILDHPEYNDNKDFFAIHRGGGIYNGHLTGFNLSPIELEDSAGDYLKNMITYKNLSEFGNIVKPNYLYAFEGLISLDDLSYEEYLELLEKIDEIKKEEDQNYSLCSYEIQILEGDKEWANF